MPEFCLMCSLPKLFRPESSDGHGSRRIRRATLTGMATLAVRGISTATSLISIPLTAHYLGTERFGLWLTLSMLLNWVNLTDLGLANSLTNLLASDSQTDPPQARRAVSSAIWLTSTIAIALALGFMLAYPWVQWDRLFNVTSAQAKSEVGLAVVVFFIGFILRLPLSIAGRIYIAHQEGYFYQAWGGLSSVLSVVALLSAIYFQMGLPQLVGVFFGTSLLGDVLANLHVFGWKWRSLQPRLADFDWNQAKWLLKTGLQFWVIQASSLIFFQTDLMIVTQLFGAEAVATYGTILKLFTLLGTVQTAFLFPLWPAYTEALARKDIAWIVRTFKKTLVFSLVWSGFSGIVCAFFTNRIINAWLNQTASIELSLILAMFTTSVLLALSHCVGTLLNGLGKIKSQAIFGLIAGVVNVLLSIILGRAIGVSGVSWSTAICLLIFSIGIIGIQTLKTLRQLSLEFEVMGQ